MSLKARARGYQLRSAEEVDRLPDDALVGTTEIAAALRVSVRTVGRWSTSGDLGDAVRTVGGWRRHFMGDVRALAKRLEAEADDRPPD